MRETDRRRFRREAPCRRGRERYPGLGVTTGEAAPCEDCPDEVMSDVNPLSDHVYAPDIVLRPRGSDCGPKRIVPRPD